MEMMNFASAIAANEKLISHAIVWIKISKFLVFVILHT